MMRPAVPCTILQNVNAGQAVQVADCPLSQVEDDAGEDEVLAREAYLPFHTLDERAVRRMSNIPEVQ